MPTFPPESIRNVSVPAVSTVNVSAEGNLIAVFVSPLWIILSGIVKSVRKVTPVPVNWASWFPSNPSSKWPPLLFK